MDLGLTDKVVLITAASKGLGKAAALEFAREGASVAICARSAALDETAAEIYKSTGAEVFAMRADVTKQQDVDALVKTTLDKFGHIDILVLNTGGPPPGTFLSLKQQDWEDAIQLTFLSVLRLCYLIVPHMLERGTGSIVASESVSVKQPMDNLILSNSIRMAVIGLLKSLANELGPKGIRVNSINPTFTQTGRVHQLLTARANVNGTDIDDETNKVASMIPLGRMGTVEEYGRAIAWIASPAASYIHGHALMFDGGATRAAL